MKRERELDERREQLTRLVMQREKQTLDGHASNVSAKIKPEQFEK